jgi:DNA-binding CsgD family transcriptional regulator
VESRADGSTVGVGLGPRNGIPEVARQAVLDAAAVLQVRRSELAAVAAHRDLPEVLIVGRGHAGVNRYMAEASTGWRELLSVRPAATTTQLRVSLPNNRALLAGGLRMVSIFDADGVELDARVLLANEPVGTYLFGVAPVQMKIVDRRSVLLQGPAIDGEPTVMAVSSAPCLEAAWRYWEAAIDSSYPAGDGMRMLGDLTPRQRQVVALMSTGLGDEAIADSLGVSVRTVRSDVAVLLDALGVRTRFAAGVRLHLWPGLAD